MYELEIINL